MGVRKRLLFTQIGFASLPGRISRHYCPAQHSPHLSSKRQPRPPRIKVQLPNSRKGLTHLLPPVNLPALPVPNDKSQLLAIRRKRQIPDHA
jgi:hypothetical protein